MTAPKLDLKISIEVGQGVDPQTLDLLTRQSHLGL